MLVQKTVWFCWKPNFRQDNKDWTELRSWMSASINCLNSFVTFNTIKCMYCFVFKHVLSKNVILWATTIHNMADLPSTITCKITHLTNSKNMASINPRSTFPYQWFYNLVLLSSSDPSLTSDPYQGGWRAVNPETSSSRFTGYNWVTCSLYVCVWLCVLKVSKASWS